MTDIDEQRRQVADQAERALIGWAMRQPDPDVFVRLLGTAPPEEFGRSETAWAMRTVADLFSRDLPTDPVAVRDRMLTEDPDGYRRLRIPELLVECMEWAATAADPAYHAGVVARAAERRKWHERSARLAQLAREGDLDKLGQFADEFTQARAGELTDDRNAHLVSGGAFILDAPSAPDALWGHDEAVVWARGESLMLCGPAGVGKTTLAVQLVAARMGIGDGKLLGLPTVPGSRRVLYLAMDRPPQISRAMRRLFTPADREFLDERLIVHKGPPPHDIARKPDTLLQMCRRAGADTVVVDSLKDAVLKLSDDESGSGYNRARQAALVDGVEVLELHHQRKANGDNKKPAQLADVYGSTWLTAGAGSVLLLWGDAGDPVVELTHLKQPREQVGPLLIVHDHRTGRSDIHDQADILMLVRYQGPVGMSARLLATVLFTTDKPKPAEVEKARRKLIGYVERGLLYERPGHGQTPATYFLAERIDGDGRS